jgi:hypothetical protein
MSERKLLLAISKILKVSYPHLDELHAAVENAEAGSETTDQPEPVEPLSPAAQRKADRAERKAAEAADE